MQKKRFDLSRTCGLSVVVGPNESWAVFNPWASREHAFSTHTHLHTRWARNIHYNWRFQTIQDSAKMDWGGKNVFVVGRGKSLGEALPSLAKKGRGPALWMNHSFVGAGSAVQDHDFCICLDDNMEKHLGDADLSKIGLICMTGVSTSLIQRNWREVRGFTFWPNAPLNSWMRELFPNFVELNESYTVNVSAVHLALLNGARRVCLVANDFTTNDSSDIKVKDKNGDVVTTNRIYAQAAYCTNMFIQIANDTKGNKVVNCTPSGLIGTDFISGTDLFKDIRHGKIENYV